MAEEKKEAPLELDSNGKKKKIMIIGIVVAILVIAGGAFFMFGGSDDMPENAGQEAAQATTGEGAEGTAAGVKPEAASVGNALYVPMPRAFRFNVPGSTRDRFVEIRVQLLVRGSDNEEVTKKHIPLLESTLLGVFSQANADDLGTSAGKTSLKQKSLDALQTEIKDIVGKNTIEQVLFTGFVMQ